MKTAIITLSLVLITLSGLSADSGDSIVIGGLDGLDPFDQRERYPVLLALSGGGARGLASIGVLRAFEEKGLTVAAITGTSIGGIIGGLYACGYNPENLTNIITNLDLTGLFSNRPARKTMFLTQREERDRHLISIRFDGFRPVLPSALTAGQRLTWVLTKLTTKATYHAAGDFAKLPIPFKAISTDIITGEEVVLDHGSLADAMRATMGFPLAFTPLEKEDRLLMDGGLVTPIPVELVRSMNDTISYTVAVNTTSQLLTRAELTNAVDIANQVTSIMTADKLAAQLEQADYTITPSIGGLGMGDFRYSDSLIEIGYRNGLVAADSIIAIQREKEDNFRFSIAQIAINDSSRAIVRTIENSLLGCTMNRKQLEEHLKSSFIELGLFRLEAHLVTLCSTSVYDREIMLAIEVVPAFSCNKTCFEFSGNDLYTDSILTGILRPDSSNITSVILRRGLDRLLRHYQQNGYDMTDITDVDVDTDANLVSVSLDEAVIDRIEIEGNRRTKDWFIRSNFPLEVGDPYSTRRASRGLSNIYATDLFNRATINLIPDDNGAMVNIGVEEKQYRQLRLGWHWHEQYQSEEFAEFLDDNVLGCGLQYLLHARYARDRQEY
ncbi:MAG: patatin-like phospholipase family protein, partial [candidate division Zixibacteria bacterium]|nr:patatin-like phospholipase family protein [candidate division Zixibacteria bacterium]